MIHTDHAGALGRRLREAIGAGALFSAEVFAGSGAPPTDAEAESAGTVTGYRCEKSPGAAVGIGLPGALRTGDACFMDLTPGLPVDVSEGDWLVFSDGAVGRVLKVGGSGGLTGPDGYRIYDLEPVKAGS